MKKIFIFLTLALSLFLTTSCFETDSNKVSVRNAMVDCFKDVDLSQVISDFNFRDQIGEVVLTYSSSNELVITNEGVVNRQDEDVVVNITVTFEINGYQSKRTYKVTVLQKQTINNVKELDADTPVSINGIVSFVVYGTEKNIPVGFYVFDDTDAIYVYSEEYAKVVNVGDAVQVNGALSKYIPEDSITAAANAGYTGAIQIVPTSVAIGTADNVIPTGFIEETSIADLCKIPVSENITSNVYKVVATVRKSVGNGFVNYYFDDLNGVDSYYAYTTSNGKDLGWLEAYDGSIRECYIAIQNCKLSASGNFWRIVPIQILDEVTVSDEVYIEYALDRLAKQFSESYSAPCSFDLVNTDEKLVNSVVSYSSSEEEGEYVAIVDGDSGYQITLNFTEEINLEVVISVTYNGITLSRVVSFTCAIEVPEIETITCAEARDVAVGEKAVVQGYIAGFLYLAGTSKPAGFQLVDESGSIAVFVSTAVDSETDITKLRIGELVYVEGYGDRYQARDDRGHTGSIRLNNAEVLYHDWQEHELPAVDEMTLAELANNPSTNNISNVVFKTTMYIVRSTGNYVNYYIHDLNNPSINMIVYSQNSTSAGPGEYKWLEEYAGLCVEAYVTLRIGAVSSGAFVWKAGVLQVLEVVDTPDTVPAYFESQKIVNSFVAEYTDAASIEYQIPTDATIDLLSSSSDAVTALKENNIFKINIAKPLVNEEVELVIGFTYGSEEMELTINFKMTKPNIVTAAEFRTMAIAKQKEIVIIEGIVTALVKSNGDTTWCFYLSDATGTIYCKTKASVKVGDKVSVKGTVDLYYGLPQVADKGMVTVISNGNQIPTNSFNSNASIDDLAANNTAGEAGNCGALVYCDVEATIHATASGQRVYIQVGELKIDLYNYTNAKYFAENYQALIALDGQTLKMTLVAFNWYNSQYTYVLAGYEVVAE